MIYHLRRDILVERATDPTILVSGYKEAGKMRKYLRDRHSSKIPPPQTRLCCTKNEQVVVSSTHKRCRDDQLSKHKNYGRVELAQGNQP